MLSAFSFAIKTTSEDMRKTLPGVDEQQYLHKIPNVLHKFETKRKTMPETEIRLAISTISCIAKQFTCGNRMKY